MISKGKIIDRMGVLIKYRLIMWMRGSGREDWRWAVLGEILTIYHLMNKI